MPAYFETGMFVREPAWHRMGHVVTEWPRTWQEAFRLSGITHEVETDRVYLTRPVPYADDVAPQPQYFEAANYQAIYRDDIERNDPASLLAIQPRTFKVITNQDFGEVIEEILKLDYDEPLRYETVLSLYGGKLIVATVYFEQPLTIGDDPSHNYSFVALTNRHDGSGGLTGTPTEFRVVCANTQRASEAIGDRRGVSFSIRHTENWRTRIEEVRQKMLGARRDSLAWKVLGEKLQGFRVGGARREAFLERFLPTSSAMTDRQVDNTEANRATIRTLLDGPTCEGIAHTGYGLVMAATEWSDHYRRHQSDASYVSRQLLTMQPNKARAFAIVREMARI